MQENNFEKRIQEQMEELKLRPSEAVWEKVEEEIRRKKKRRVVFFISLLAGLSLLSYSGYLLINKSKPNLVEQNSTLTDKKEPVNINNQPGAETKREEGKTLQPGRKKDQLIVEEKRELIEEKNVIVKQQPNSTTNTGIAAGNKQTNKDEKSPPTATGKTKVNQSIAEKEDIIAKKKSITPTNNKEQLVQTNITKNRNRVVATKKPSVSKESSSLVERSEPGQQEVSKPLANKTDIVSPADPGKKLDKEKNAATEQELAAGEKNTMEAKKDSIAEEDVVATIKEEIKPATPKKRKNPVINFGLEFSYGVSSNREKALSIGDGQKSMDVTYNAPQSSSPFTPATANASAIYHQPSSIESGDAFRVGVIAEMKLTKRSTVSSGLRYAYFSNNIKVGAYKDTAISFTNLFTPDFRTSAIYRGYQRKDFVNRFHFIQLPLQYELQLNKGVKLPISWNIGATVGYLVSTNALVYDTAANGIYYHDKGAFNKLQWNLNTGFSFRFNTKHKLQWSLGPELSLGMNRLTKDYYARKQYLLYGGITGRVILAKKK